MRTCLLIAAVITLATGCAMEMSLPPEVAMEEAFPGQVGAAEAGYVDFGNGPQAVEYEIINDLAIMEGDIILGSAKEIPSADPSSDGEAKSAIRVDHAWPNGVIPYLIAPFFSEDQRADIQDAIDYWNDFSPITLVERTSQHDYVYFHPGDGCSSYVGRQGGAQFVYLGTGCDTGNTMHEIGHTVGLLHEHTRSDRDAYVDIHWWNIEFEEQHNFQTYESRGYDGRDIGSYDFDSIMHYSGHAFGLNAGFPTISYKGTLTPVVAQRDYISDGDLVGVADLYLRSMPKTRLRMQNMRSGRCAKVSGYNPGDRVRQYTCDGSSRNLWYRVWPFDGGVGQLYINSATKMCLAVTNASTSTNAVLEQQPCTGEAHQRFLSLTNNRIKNLHSNMCLEILNASTAAGASVVQSTCDSAVHQMWFQLPY